MLVTKEHLRRVTTTLFVGEVVAWDASLSYCVCV